MEHITHTPASADTDLASKVAESINNVSVSEESVCLSHRKPNLTTAVPKRRQAADISHRMSRLSSKCNRAMSSNESCDTVRPRKQQSSEIAEISSQLSKKLNPTIFTKEVHLKPSDPGYGTPQEGTKTAVRGRKAHENISNEIVEMAELIWEHGQMTGLLNSHIYFSL